MSDVQDKEPRMLRHKRSGQAFIVVRDPDGRRRQVSLGPWGSEAAQRRFHAELTRWHTRRKHGPLAAELLVDEPQANLTIADAAARWLAHCERYYRHEDGTPTSEVQSCRYAVVPLIALFGDQPLSDLTTRKLRLVQQRMIDGEPETEEEAEQRTRPRGWCRNVVNQAIGRIRAFVKWCVAEDFVAVAVYQTLCTLPPLKRGRTEARETKPTMPVPDALLHKTLPHLPPVVADMALLQRLVGMRGAELCAMTSAELDRSQSLAEGCWVFRPTHSKLSYRGRDVQYVLGPKAVAIVKRYLRADPNAPLFSPADSERQRHELMRERRKSKVQPSQEDRRVANPKRPPGDRYEPCAYARCIRYACERAGLEVWSPHGLRRARATEVRARFGLEAARCVIGHQTVEMATLYGHQDLKVAAEVAKVLG